ncbi:MAG: hypothetical protein HZA81_01365 [Candidatus Taylorbacteria bacterium]|nr:hypothetical protein [Candidatus Taylorbacteria bacterium]
MNQGMKKTEYNAFLFAHFALFVVFVWFGSLKLFGLSPANPLVSDLFGRTLGIILPMSADTFIVCLGLLEVLIGILFVIPRAEKVGMGLLAVHMVTTIMPLFLLPDMTWSQAFVPTLEGQYIIKNIVIIALAATVFADLGKKRRSAL